MLSIYFCFRRHSGVGRTCNWFDPVANDPKPTLSSRSDSHARAMKGFSPAGAGPLRRAASSAAIARLSARP
jgi:hypothetical protein